MADPRVQVVVEAVDRASGTLNRIGQNLNTSLRRVSMGLLLVGGTITAFSTLAVKAAIDQRIAVDRVRGSMSRLGDSYEAHGAKIEGMIDEVARLTGFSKTELNDAFNMLINATGSVTLAAAALPAAAAMAEVAGGGLEAAIGLIIGAISGDEGAINQLRLLGVNLTNLENPFTITTDVLKTFKEESDKANKVTQDFKVTVSDFRVAVGNAVIPVLEETLAALKPVVDMFIVLVESHPAIVGAIGAIGVALLGLAGAISAVRIALLALGPLWAVLAGIAAVAAAPIALTISLIVGAIASLILIALLLWKHWNDIWGWIVGAAQIAWQGLKDTWADWQGIFTALGDAVAGLWTRLIEIWGWIGDLVENAGLRIHLEIEILKSRFRLFLSWFKDFFHDPWKTLWGLLVDVVQGAIGLMLTALGPIGVIINNFMALILWIEGKLSRSQGAPPPGPAPTPVPQFQHGGVTSGGLSLVGENGPELAMFPGGTRIMPAGSFGGGAAITVNINGPVYGLSDLDRHIVETIRRAIDGGGFYQSIFPSGRR